MSKVIRTKKSATNDNLNGDPNKSRRYAVDVISPKPVNDMVLIEACIPVFALDQLMAFLKVQA
jgi:hypothetical protein